MKFHILIADNRSCKLAGYNVTSCFRSAAKCNYYNTAQRCVKRVWPAYRRIIRLRFDTRSQVMTHWSWLNVCRDCKVEWCGILPSSINWWASFKSTSAAEELILLSHKSRFMWKHKKIAKIQLKHVMYSQTQIIFVSDISVSKPS